MLPGQNRTDRASPGSIHEPRFKLFVGLHKDFPLPPGNRTFAALGLGGYRPNNTVESFSDAVGDSISHKNKYYSELTGWYWIWKNMPQVDIAGLCHYRRYFFLNDNDVRFIEKKLYLNPLPDNLAALIDERNESFVRRALAEVFDVIVPKRQTLEGTIAVHYQSWHGKENWQLFIQGIAEVCPDLRPHLPWFDIAHDLYLYNLLIAPKTFLEAYLSRFFAVMEWLEPRADFGEHPYQRRVPAFLGERFLSFYLYATRARCCEVPVVVLEPAAF